MCCPLRAAGWPHNRCVCGRYAASKDGTEVAGWFEAEQLPDFELPPRFNIAPTQESFIVADHEGTRTVDVARWGLIPSWSKDASRASSMINARCETVANKPAYRSAFKRRRCLVPVDGYYEWQAGALGASGGAGTRPPKQPFYIHSADGHPLALAGLFEDWRGPDGTVRTFTVLTQDPPNWLSRVHDRMPVIVQSDMWHPWLSGVTQESEVGGLLRLIVDHSAQGLEAYPVSTAVNRSSNEGPDLTMPVGPILHVG